MNEKCRKKGCRHFIQHCVNSDEETKTNLREEYRTAKRMRTEKGKISILTQTPSVEHHSALFSASFASGKVTCKVLVNQGADVNLLPEAIVKQIIKLENHEIRHFSNPKVYKTLSGLVCAKYER